MRYIVLLVLFFSINLLAQELPKADSIAYSPSGNYAAIYKGKKSALYDLKNQEYILKPSKSFIHVYRVGKSDPFNCFAVVEKERAYMLVLNDAGEKMEVPDSGGYVSIAYGIDSLNNPGTKIVVNGKKIDFKTGEKDKSNGLWNAPQIGFEILNDGNVLINNFSAPIVSYSNEGLPKIIEKEIMASGIYSIEKRQWVIPPVYAEVNVLNDHFFCRKFDKYIPDEYFLQTNYLYDLFLYSTSGYELVKKSFLNIDNKFLAQIIGVDELIPVDDNLHFITKKNGKYGFITFGLDWFNGPIESKEYFYYEEHYSPKFDFIRFNKENQVLLTVGGFQLPMSPTLINADLMLMETDDALNAKENRYQLANSDDYIMVNGDWLSSGRISTETGQYEYGMGNEWEFQVEKINKDERYDYEGNFGMQLVNDTMLLVIDYERQNYEPIPLQSIGWPGEDSINAEGMVVYKAPPLPYQNSGLFNLNSRKWELSPTHHQLLATQQGVLIENVEYNDADMSWDWQYSFETYAGDYVFSNLTSDSVMNNPNLYAMTIQDRNVDTLFQANSGFFAHRLNDFMVDYYYYSGTDLGLLTIYNNYFMDRKRFRQTHDFIHCNKDINACYYLENDSIYLEIDSMLFCVSQSHGEIRYEATGFDGICTGYNVEIWDTINSVSRHDFVRNMEIDQRGLPVKSSIKIIDGRLVVNENYKGEQWWEVDEYMELYAQAEIERECSSIWEKKNGRWEKVTPYYAKVIPVPLGYIVKTGDYYSNIPILDEWYWETFEYKTIEKREEGRYILLDTNLKAIQFLDWFDFSYMEDLGFGIQICTTNGCFLVDYSGKTLTNAVWHDFEMEDGDLYGIQYDFFDPKAPGDWYEDLDWGEGIEPIVIERKLIETSN